LPAMPRTLSRVVRGTGRSLLPEVGSFDDVPEATVVEVDLDRTPAPGPTTRTVQPDPAAGLVVELKEPTFPLRVAVIRDGRLATSSGAVITRDGRLVRATLWDEDHWLRSFCPPPKLAEPLRVKGRHAAVISLWGHNFFHWMFEALPRLAVLQASGVTFDRLIVPERLAPFQAESLRLLGFGSERLLPFTNEHVQPEELVWASPLAPVGYPTPFLVKWLRGSFGAPEGIGDRRVYIERASRTG
jgi:hypothetical protein